MHYYSDDWVLIKELGDQKACLALRQKPLMVPRLRWKRKGDQNLSERKVLGINIHADNLTRRPRLSPSRRSSRKRSFVHYNSSDWVLIDELGDPKVCLALALRQKPLMVLPLRWKRKGDQNLSE